MEMERMVTHAPCHRALVRIGMLISLTFNAQIHNMISADGTVVDDDIPSPEPNGVPFLYFEPFLRNRLTYRVIWIHFSWTRRYFLRIRLFTTLPVCN